MHVSRGATAAAGALADLHISACQHSNEASHLPQNSLHCLVLQVRGDAEVDLMLCSDPTCTVMVDLVKVQKPGEPGPEHWLMASSGITPTSFRTATGTAANLLRGNLEESTSDSSLLASEATTVHEVIWQLDEQAGDVLQNRDLLPSCSKYMVKPGYPKGLARFVPPVVLPIAVDTWLASKPTSPWSVINVGHFMVQDVLTSNLLPTPLRQGCVTLLWPNHSWLHDHGWGKSHPQCAEAYSKVKKSPLNTYCWAPSHDDLTPVMALDSMFPQAQVLHGTEQDIMHILGYNGSEQQSITNETVALVMLYAGDKLNPAAGPVFPKMGPCGSSESDRVARYQLLTDYLQLAGRLSATLTSLDFDWQHTVWHTQLANGCVAPCTQGAMQLYPKLFQDDFNTTFKDGHCGTCTLLHVGTATCAATPISLKQYTVLSSSDPWAARKIAPAGVVTALQKLYAYSTQFTDKFSPWYCVTSEQNDLPYAYGVGDNITYYLTVLMQNVSDPLLYKPVLNPATLDIDRLEARQERMQAASVLANCSWWEETGFGFPADSKRRSNSKAVHARQPTDAMRLASQLGVAWWPAGATPPNLTFGQDTVYGFDMVMHQEVQDAVGRVIFESMRLLEHQVAQKLATTDSTKTWLGAIWDMSVVVVGIVAMATGRRDGEAYIAKWLTWLCLQCIMFSSLGLQSGKGAGGRGVVCAAKVLYCVFVVPLGLIVAPATVLASDLLAREDNPKGRNSDLGWLSSEVISFNEDASYVVVGTIAIRMTTVLDDVALVMLYVNLGLAFLGTLLIAVASYRHWLQSGAASACAAPTPTPTGAGSSQVP